MVKRYSKPKLDEDLVARQTPALHRGLALGLGNTYIGKLDGRLIAVDMKTGKDKWEIKLIDSKKPTVGFTGAPLFVKDKLIIGTRGGEWPTGSPSSEWTPKPARGCGGYSRPATTMPPRTDSTPDATDCCKTGGGAGWIPGRP